VIDKRATVLILTLATAAACGGWWLQTRLQAPHPAAPTASVPAQNARAIDLVLPDLQGRPQRLSQWRGKRVLLNFWATWCAPCRKEMPELAAAQGNHQNLQVVGVALDQADAVRDYLKKTPVNYPILIGIDAEPDPTSRFGDSIGALPYSVLIGPDGRIERSKLGPFQPGELSDWLMAKD